MKHINIYSRYIALKVDGWMVSGTEVESLKSRQEAATSSPGRWKQRALLCLAWEILFNSQLFIYQNYK